jgi:hypothetical protein
MTLSTKSKKFLKWLFPFAFSIGGTANMASVTTLPQEVGTKAAFFLTAHGVTTPIMGAILLGGATVITAIHVERAKQPVAVADDTTVKTVKKINQLSKKYGPDWLDKLDALAKVAAELQPKKK